MTIVSQFFFFKRGGGGGGKRSLYGNMHLAIRFLAGKSSAS